MRAMCFGTFDFVHKGHEFYLLESKKLADELVVVIARDETVLQVKGRLPKKDEEQRKKDVESLKIANRVILGNPGDKLKVVVDEIPDIICLGYDQRAFTEGLLEKLKEKGVEPKIVRIDSYLPEKYKSSKIN